MKADVWKNIDSWIVSSCSCSAFNQLRSVVPDIIDKRLVDPTDAARGGVVACEVPVAVVVGAGGVQAFDALEDEFDGRLYALRTQHLHHLRIDFLGGERGVD